MILSVCATESASAFPSLRLRGPPGPGPPSSRLLLRRLGRGQQVRRTSCLPCVAPSFGAMTQRLPGWFPFHTASFRAREARRALPRQRCLSREQQLDDHFLSLGNELPIRAPGHGEGRFSHPDWANSRSGMTRGTGKKGTRFCVATHSACRANEGFIAGTGTPTPAARPGRCRSRRGGRGRRGRR